jgi:hypothetical protein
MILHKNYRPILAALFLALVAAIVFSQMEEGALLAQVFDGGGLVDGLSQAQGEISGTGVRDDTDFIAAIGAVINFILTFAGIFAFVAFVAAGFVFILGFGSDSANQRARKIMIWAAVGLVVIIFAFVLVQFIVDFATA